MHSNRQNVSKQQQQQHQNHCTCGGGSSSRRWVPIASVAIFLCLIASGVSKTQAVSLALPTDDGPGDGGVIAASAQLLHRALRDVAAFAANFVPDDARDATVNGGTMGEASSSSSSPSASSGSSSSSSSSSSSTQPQGQCLLDGILVAETTVFCEKQVGCRAIQKTGHCCPDYKCDCEKDGKTYSNGDKLVDPETPCTVCYCQGGEILCSSVTCYHRDDCTPKFISGRCCPEYDNCPVSSPEPTTTTNKTLIDSMAAFASSTVKPEVPAAALNPKITIKEITKPIEIRITDENKAIPIHQMLKPSTTTTTTTTTTSTTTTTTEAATASTATTIANSAAAATTNTLSQTQTSSEDGSSAKASSSTNESFSGDANQQQHNNNNNKHNGNNNNNNRPTGGINNESLKLSASVAYASTEHPTMMGSAGTGNGNGIPFTTRAQEVHEIVMVDNRNGGEKPFAAFGTQGLQRVESEGANDPSKVNIKREFLDTTEGVAPGHASSSSSSSSSSSHSNSNFNYNLPVTSSSSSDEFGSSELLYGQPGAGPTTSSTGQGQGHVGNLLHSSGELAEPETAGSDNIYHIILTTDGPRVGGSTENYLALKGSQTEGLNAFESSFNLGHEDSQLSSSSESSFASSTERLDSSTEGLDTSSSYDSSTQEPSASSTETIHHHSHNHNHQHHLTEDEDIAIPMESNPAYPSLPEDDFSLRDVNFPLNENDDDLKDEPRSIGGGSFDALKSTKHLDDLDTFRHLGSGSGSGDMESSTWQSSSTESSGDMMNSTPKVALMYSMEDGSSSSSQETAVSNATDFHSIVGSRLKESENETDSDESLEIDSVELIADGGSGSGAGSGDFGEKKAKQREHTTPRPARGAAEGLDIDELGSAEGPKSPLEDPKLDVESLKLDESHDDGLAKPDAVTKANILAVKTNAAQDRTVEPLMGSGIVQRLFLQRVY